MKTANMEIQPQIDFNSPAHQKDPYATYRLMRSHHPVCRVQPTEYWAVTRFDDVKFVLKRHDIFSSEGCRVIFEPDWIRPACRRNVLVFKDPPQHTPYRSLLNRLFAGHIVRSLIPLMQKTSATIVHNLPAAEFDFLENFAFPYIGGIVTELVGINGSQSIGELRQWVDTLAAAGPIRPDNERVKALEAAILSQQRRFIEILRDRQRHPQDDFVTALINAEIDGKKLPEKTLVDTIDVLVASGFHTTVQTLCNIVFWLSSHPKTVRRLKFSAQLIPAFVEEMLRMKSNGHATIRRAVKDVVLSGVTIPQSAFVLAIMAAANRDPTHFSRPDKVDMARENIREHLSFGIGPHTCPGAALVRLELRIALQALLSQHKTIVCDKRRAKPFNTVTTFGFKELPVQLH